MKRFERRLLLAPFLLLLLGGCRHHTIIPDDELAQIFHDAFLVNAYLQNTDPRRDSLLVYEPIFARYGYTTEDVRYTIGNFSKRKSARLGDVVEMAIARLDSEGRRLDKLVANLDTVDQIALRTATRIVRRDTAIRVTALRDTTRLRFVVDSVQSGEYRIRARYQIDSADKNESVRAHAWLETADGTRTGGNSPVLMRRYVEQAFDRTLKADTTSRRLVVDFWQLRQGASRKAVAVTVKELEISYTPPQREALEQLYEKDLDIRIFAERFLFPHSADSGARAADSARVAETPAR